MGVVHGLLNEFAYGRGFDEVLYEANPAAGASFALPMDSRYTSRLISIIFTLATDANVANRFVTVDEQDGNGVVINRDGAGVVVTAGSTQQFVGQSHRAVGEWATGTSVFFPLSGRFIEGGRVVRINVGGIQVGDQLSGIVAVFERFPSDRHGYPEGVSHPGHRAPTHHVRYG